jgi:hypothetical protein
MTRLVTEDMVSNALQILAETAEKAASAKAMLVRAEHEVKRVKARMVLQSSAGTLGLREADAVASDEVREAVRHEANAAQIYEHLRLLRSNAEAVIEAWRTESASIRAAERIR